MALLENPNQTVFALLDLVRERPKMYVGATTHPLSELEMFLYGYYAALGVHGIVESVPEMTNHFSTWLYSTRGWSGSYGWAAAIRSHARKRDELELFFELVEAYRTLIPTTVCTGKPGRPSSVNKALQQSITEQPTRIEIVRYKPTRLHFLRLWRRNRANNDWILMTGKGSHETNLAFAKRSAEKMIVGRTLVWRQP